MVTTSSVSLPQGTIEYHDSDPGGGPDAVVFVHGLLVDGSLWDGVVERMPARHRCIVLELPLGCHRVPLAEGADRTPAGVAALVADVLEALDLDGVTLVGNDTGGALCQWVAANRPERLARLVLTPCDSYDEFLPAIFRPLQWAARVPGALRLAIAPLRVRRLRRLPIAFGRLAKKPIPHVLGDRWVDAFLSDRRVRHDAVTFTAAPAVDPATWSVSTADHDGDGRDDLVLVNRAGTMTEVHALSAASGFTSYLLQTATALGPTGDDTWSVGG